MDEPTLDLCFVACFMLVVVAVLIYWKLRVSNEMDMRLGSTVWIEHKPDGDVYYRVKLIMERQPGSVEFCRVCHRGQLGLMGHIIQRGILDDKIYAVTHCDHCCAITVFIYHVETGQAVLPESGDCRENETGSSSF